MATDLTSTKPEVSKPDFLGEINKYDFRNEERYVFKAARGSIGGSSKRSRK